METAFLTTRLQPPQPRQGAVVRSRLTDLITRGTESKLTLVSAPPGFGKSTLVGEWAAARPSGVALGWLSLDLDDNDPATFWSYVVAAIRMASPSVGRSALAALEAEPPRIEQAQRALTNDLAAVSDTIVLVLDDYHVIDRADIHDGVAQWIDRLPSSTHVVLTTRSDPPLPLSRWRVRGELVEIRAKELRFTPGEAEAYLKGTMGLALSERDVDAIEARTEGWIAALQLAALSMRGRDDIASFVASFAGDDRYVVDYLVDEVLARQPDDVQSFLLETSILDRLTGALCDAVTQRRDSQEMLERLDRGNLLVQPLDDRRRWYRYHQLFADVLRSRLLAERPHAVLELHRRAGAWLDDHGNRTEAIHHALVGQDFERAATLVELAMLEMQRTRRELTLRKWIEALPEELLESRPVLAIGYVGALMSDGTMEGVEARLDWVERWLESGPGTQVPAGGTGEIVVVDTTQAERLPGLVAMYRAALALGRGDLDETAAQAERAVQRAAPDDYLARGAAGALLGLARWTTGDLEGAYQSFSDGMTSVDRAGHEADAIGGAITLADIRMTQGRLSDALTLYERGLARAARPDVPPLRGVADMHVGIAKILGERGDLTGAKEHLAYAQALGEELGLPQHPWRWRVAAARLRQVERDLDAAMRLVEEATPVYSTDFSPNVRPIEAVKARLYIERGELELAAEWARQRGVSLANDITYLREFEHATLARLLYAQGLHDRDDTRLGDAVALTERLAVAAASGGRNGSLIEILIVHALSHSARGDRMQALDALTRAVALAEPEGYVSLFVLEGDAMTDLLGLAVKERPASAYLHRLLRAPAGPPPTSRPIAQPLLGPLSQRELEILRLLATELSGPEIARNLVVSLHTVRSHTKAVFAKLGVNSRRAAVRRAAELNLLTPPRDQ
jgi:LuxR family maltose regulon positive regulatory protein